MSAGAGRVLGALRRAGGGPCSGEALSQALGVSRSQVWKHVEALRGRGYAIEGAPGGGYLLRAAPDRLYPEEIQAGLATRWLGHAIHHFESTDSTNRVALELAREGAAHGTAVVAEAQTAGRGRLGRSFYSPPHANLYLSLVLRPDLSTADAPTAILAAATGVAEAVAEETGAPGAVGIKWPNDVELDGKKTAGILMELAAEATRVRFLVLGIGVNLNASREGFPEEFRARATSLRSHLGRAVDRAAFARRLLGALEPLLERHADGGFAALRPRFERFFRMEGAWVRVAEPGGRETSGVVAGVGEDAALLLRAPSGEAARVLAGDVTVVKEARPA